MRRSEYPDLLQAGGINTRFDNLVRTAEQSVTMSEAVPDAKPAQEAKPLGMRKNGTQSRAFPSPRLPRSRARRKTDSRDRQAVARPEEGLPAGLRADVLREAHSGESRHGHDEGQGEGAQGRKGGRETGKKTRRSPAYATPRLTSSQQRVQRIKDKRAAKEEKERYEKMAEKMHKKRVERLKRKEKRNKLLNS